MLLICYKLLKFYQFLYKKKLNKTRVFLKVTQKLSLGQIGYRLFKKNPPQQFFFIVTKLSLFVESSSPIIKIIQKTIYSENLT